MLFCLFRFDANRAIFIYYERGSSDYPVCVRVGVSVRNCSRNKWRIWSPACEARGKRFERERTDGGFK